MQAETTTELEPRRPDQASTAPSAPWRSTTHNRLIQYISLLYSIFFFITPYYEHSLKHWIWFGVFYITFLVLYFGVSMARTRTAYVCLGLLYLIGFVYVPFNQSAAGIFVYPVVITAFVMREPRIGVALRRYLAVMAAQIAAVYLEIWLLHLPSGNAKGITFSLVVIGLSNFAYSRQQLISEQLELANAEIERLAQTAERERIARDLHDLLGHTLTVIVIKSDLANRVFAVDPDMAHREIQEVEQTARKALAEVREAVAGYRAEGIAAEIAQARRALTAAGVQLTTNVAPEPLSEKQLNTLCLVLREAITNVARHARATGCNLELHRDGSLVRLIVEDNGIGQGSGEGNGLRGMRERIAAIGGSLLVQYPKTGGTRLLIEFPVATRVAEPAAPDCASRTFAEGKLARA